MDYVNMSLEELEARMMKLQKTKDAAVRELIAAAKVRDVKLAEKSLADKLANFTPAELELLASKAQVVSGVGGLASGESVGTPGK
jgi:hypothetical protein